MSNQPQTIAHSFALNGLHEVLEAAAQIPVHESLDAAIYRLEAMLGGIRELMQVTAVSNKATLVYFAAESALALVIAAHAGVAPSRGGAV